MEAVFRELPAGTIPISPYSTAIYRIAASGARRRKSSTLAKNVKKVSIKKATKTKGDSLNRLTTEYTIFYRVFAHSTTSCCPP